MTGASAFSGARCLREETGEGTVAVGVVEVAVWDRGFWLLSKVEMEKKREFQGTSFCCCTIITGPSSRYCSF